jgi:hypothetical protein
MICRRAVIVVSIFFLASCAKLCSAADETSDELEADADG